MKHLGFSAAVPAIVNALRDDGDILNLVSRDNIYPLIKTSDFPLPSVSVTRTGWQGTYAKAPLFSDRRSIVVSEAIQIQINVFSRSYDDANAIAEAIILVLDGQSFEFNGVTVTDISLQSAVEAVVSPDLAVFQETLTFSCRV